MQQVNGKVRCNPKFSEVKIRYKFTLSDNIYYITFFNYEFYFINSFLYLILHYFVYNIRSYVFVSKFSLLDNVPWI